MNYKKLPLINKIYSKIENRFLSLEKEISDFASQNIDLRIKLKKINHEKINVVFVCHRPSLWGSLKTVYEAMKNDSDFNVKIVTIPMKKQLPKLGFNHEIYESEGAENFWTSEDVISGYNYETKEFFDIKTLNPDYVCFQQPYNVCRPECLKSHVVSKYAKVFYVHYASNFIGSGILEDSNPPDFIRNVSFYFNQNKTDYDLIKIYNQKLNNTFTKQYLTGFPRYDELEKYKNTESEVWNYTKTDKKFRVIWTPRWCTNEGNCSFFDYKDEFLSLCKENGKLDFVFRPHPQAFINWEATGELSKENAEKYKAEYEALENAKIDFSGEYFSTFFSSDCLVTDISSIVSDYFVTGKPIIYCHKKDCFNDFSRKLSSGFYWVKNWDELSKTLSMLEKGEDPLKEKREQLLKEEYAITSETAGHKIKEIIKESQQ